MQQIGVQKGNTQWKCHVVLGIVCILVLGIFIWSAEPGFLELSSHRPGDSYYNLLVQGFRAGQLNVEREAPPGLAQLRDPYDPAVNGVYTWDTSRLLLDMSYYKGKLYLYFGPTPALVLFWPYAVLTGHYLSHKSAVIIFYSVGFLLAAGLLCAVWRRYFPEVNVWVLALGTLALGLATGIPEIISRCDVWEVAMSCGFTFTMLALLALWRALHESKLQVVWLLLASLAYGLAIGSRPSLLFGAIILLAPVAQAWRATAEPGSRRHAGLLFVAAVGPLMLIGAGLMLYNALRFDNPFEFGWHYQLVEGYQPNTAQQFSSRYFWINFLFYFLEPMRWSGHFPFLHAVSWSPVPSGYFGVGEPYSGILSNYPVVWLALAAPLAWRGRPAGEVSGLRWFATASLLLFVTCASTLCLFFSASNRYETDFLPALMLLAVVGIFGVERVLVRSPWRFLARTGWGLLLAYSLVFNFLASVKAHAAADYFLGCSLFNQGRANEGVGYLQKALVLEPQSAAFHIGLGNALRLENRADEAIVQFQEALALHPKAAKAYNALGNALRETGDMDQAMANYKKALEIDPDYAAAHIDLGQALFERGQVNEAIVQYQKVVALRPESASAHNDLGYCLSRAGRVDEAIAQFQKSLQIRPDYYLAYYNLGRAFYTKGMATKAIDCYEKVIKLQPQSIPARVNLAWMLATWPEPSVRNGDKALALAEQAKRLSPVKDPIILRTLAAAYAEKGQFPEAVATAQEALSLATSQSASGLTNSLRKEIELYQTHSPCRTRKE